MPFVEAAAVEAFEVIRGFSMLVVRVTEPLMSRDEAVGKAFDAAVVKDSVIKDGALVGTEPTTIVGNASVIRSVALKDPLPTITVAEGVIVEDVVIGISYGWSEVIRNTVFDNSVIGGGSGDSLMKIDSTVIVDLFLLTSLAFVAEIFELTGDFVVITLGSLTLLWGVTSENIMAEAGVGEVVGVKK